MAAKTAFAVSMVTIGVATSTSAKILKMISFLFVVTLLNVYLYRGPLYVTVYSEKKDLATSLFPSAS